MKGVVKMSKLSLCLVSTVLAAGLSASADSLNKALGYCRLSSGCANSTYVTIFNELEEMDDAADRAWRALPNRQAYDLYRHEMHDKMIAAMGGFPEKTPLNARSVAAYRKDGYRSEQVIC